jgi:hypothetical protein
VEPDSGTRHESGPCLAPSRSMRPKLHMPRWPSY